MVLDVPHPSSIPGCSTDTPPLPRHDDLNGPRTLRILRYPGLSRLDMLVLESYKTCYRLRRERVES